MINNLLVNNGEKKIMNKKKKKGFTLIELIVVIAILGILSAVAIPRFAGIQDNARQSTDMSSAKTVQSAVRIHEAQNGSLPTVTSLATFNTAFAAVLPEGVPEIQKTSAPANHFYYNASTGEFVCDSAAPTGTWITIR